MCLAVNLLNYRFVFPEHSYQYTILSRELCVYDVLPVAYFYL